MVYRLQPWILNLAPWFQGQMLNFYFDQYDFFSYLKEGNWPDGTEGDGTITGTGNPVPENKVESADLDSKQLCDVLTTLICFKN